MLVLFAFAMGWLVLLTVVSLVLRGFGVKRLAVSFHAAWVVFIIASSALYFANPHGQSVFFWVFPMVLAMPLSLLADHIPICKTVRELPLVIGLLGCLQYFLIGWSADAVIGVVKRRNKSGGLV